MTNEIEQVKLIIYIASSQLHQENLITYIQSICPLIHQV